MVDSFTRSAGKIELSELVEALNRVLRYTPNLKPDPLKEGIHKQQMDQISGAGVESWTPIHSFSQFSEDGTSAVANVTNLVRPGHLPNIEETKIEELQKGCFVNARTVKDFFAAVKGTRDGVLSKNIFFNALDELQLHWPVFES